MILGEPLSITGIIAHALEQLQNPYLVGDSLASSLHGIPRATHDVDIVADMTPAHVMPFVETLGSGFYVDADSIREAIAHRLSFNVIHLETMFKVDIFLLKADRTSQNEMMRREAYQLTDQPLQVVYISSAEDSIVKKLQWFRLGNEVSERQWQDVLGILEVRQGNLDLDYLQQAAEQLDVKDLLKRLFDEAGLKL